MSTELRYWIFHTTSGKLVFSLVCIVALWIFLRFIKLVISKNVKDNDHRYRSKKLLDFFGFVITIAIIIIVFSAKMNNVTVALGIAGAGIAFALQEVITNIAGWLAIMLGGFYKTGDRVQLGGIKGDVIDIGVVRTTLMEVGEWVDGDLYNGRIVRVANSFVFKEPVYNYSGDFEFLWDEIKIPIQYGSNYEKARELFLNIANEICGESAKVAEHIQQHTQTLKEESKHKKQKSICAIVFGSDQGLVGQFNDVLSNFVIESLKKMDGKKVIWSVGERVQERLSDSEFKTEKLFSVPNSVSAITPLVGQLLISIEEARDKDNINEFYIFYNFPKTGAGYEPFSQRLLPFDASWTDDLNKRKWPTKKLPQIIGDLNSTFAALIREYLFVSIYKASAESLASENASRLEAMQRAEKNINELLDELNNKFHRLRQSSIDEELFDVVSGFEALRNTEK